MVRWQEPLFPLFWSPIAICSQAIGVIFLATLDIISDGEAEKGGGGGVRDDGLQRITISESKKHIWSNLMGKQIIQEKESTPLDNDWLVKLPRFGFASKNSIKEVLEGFSRNKHLRDKYEFLSRYLERCVGWSPPPSRSTRHRRCSAFCRPRVSQIQAPRKTQSRSKFELMPKTPQERN